MRPCQHWFFHLERAEQQSIRMPDTTTESASTRKSNKGLSPIAWVGIGCGGLLVVGLIALVAVGMFVGKKVKDAVADADGNPERFAAEMFVKMNPDLEMIESGKEDGMMKIRVKKSGEEISVSYKDLKEGKLSIGTADGGSVKFDAKAKGGQIVATDAEGKTTVMETDGKIVKMQGADGATVMTIGGGDIWKDLPGEFKGLAYPRVAEGLNAMTSQVEGKTTSTVMFTIADKAADVEKFYMEQLKAAGYAVEQETMAVGEVASIFLKARKDNKSVDVSITSDRGKAPLVTFQSELPK